MSDNKKLTEKELKEINGGDVTSANIVGYAPNVNKRIAGDFIGGTHDKLRPEKDKLIPVLFAQTDKEDKER